MKAETKDMAGEGILFLDQLEDFDRKKREALRRLLTEVLHDEGHLFVEKSEMGGSDSFHGVASLSWISQNLQLYTSLPLFQKMWDPKKEELIIDETSVNEMRQRVPSHDRQYMLATYLLRQKNRKFPAIMAVVSEPWTEDTTAHEWVNGRATRSSMPFEELDSAGRLGLIDFRKDFFVFVIDGAHRLLGIRGALDAVLTKSLKIWNKAGTKVLRTIPLDEFLAESNLEEDAVMGLPSETMGIELIPAVMKGETREEARIRVRSVFNHVNKTATPPMAGELILLDENDGFSLITRQVGRTHPLFHKDKAGDRINWKSTSLPAGSMWLTPVMILADMARNLLKDNSNFEHWDAGKREIPLRPTDDQLRQGGELFQEFLDQVARLPSFGAIMRGDQIDEWREFPDTSGDKQKGHLLMRPLGQLALAKAVGHLHYATSGPQIPLDRIFEKLGRFDQGGGFSRVDQQKSYFYGITYDSVHKKMLMTSKSVAADLLIYLLGGMNDPNERDNLTASYRKGRTFEKSETEVLAWNWDGKLVKGPKDIQLPPLLT